eukprot:Lithocolla_globosa_v1_NODE_2885_length_1835_cov_3.374157.p3 type:complete len:115 gc:universal NODE_2885_length_1835_cov_3.374157:514-170(-)
MNFSVKSWCSRSIELVPGVSTRLMCRSSGTVSSSLFSSCHSLACSGCVMICSWCVVGTIPVLSWLVSSKAFMSVLFPTLNSPTTTSKNGLKRSSVAFFSKTRCSEEASRSFSKV